MMNNLLRSTTPKLLSIHPSTSLSTIRCMATGTRGARGHGWLQKYRAGLGGRHLQGRWHYRNNEELNRVNDEVFAMNAKDGGDGDDSSKNNKNNNEAFLDISVGGEEARRVVIELAAAALPKTVQNFKLLCQEKKDHGYESTKLYKIEKTVGLCLGDVVSNDGTGGRCHPSVGTDESPFAFEDEGFVVSHTGPGIVSMMSPGVHRNDSRFLITTTEAPQLDGRFVAFGRVKEGMDVVNDIATSIFTKRGRPTVDVRVVGCGVV
mmetsp:Transcript_29085/g.45762  ORF Transcript_29085/g.45762 Transcript_29085/m.45762 type:complete len:263 (+) Transcript_29085:28-816(+)